MWLFLGSFEVFLLHELKDYKADLAAGVATYVVNVGDRRAHQLRNFVHMLAIVYALGAFGWFSSHMQHSSLWLRCGCSSLRTARTVSYSAAS